MSESEESFESAKDKEIEEKESSESSDDDEPLVKKGKKTPKASSKKSSPQKSAKKGENTRNGKQKSKSPAKKEKGRVSFNLVANSSPEKVEEEYEVENIVGHREYNGKLMYKIRWKNYEPIHDTWEDLRSLACPDILESYNLKNNVRVPKSALSEGGGKKRGRGRPTSKGANGKKRKSSVSSSDEESGEKRGRGRPPNKGTNGNKRKSSVSSSDEEGDVPYDEGSDAEYEVNKIVEMRTKKDGTREFLVHWKRWSSDYDTWEPEENLSCPDLIEQFMIKVEKAKNSNVKELRENRKPTQRFTLNTRDTGRRLSKRNNQKQRVQYFGNEASSGEE